MLPNINEKSPIIVALDVPERARAIDLATALRHEVAMVKVGLEGFVGFGPDLVRELVDAGIDVFLDLKLHDIPRTAAAAAAMASRLGVRLLTVHASGGTEMIRAARDAAGEGTKIIAVTLLTSLDATAVADIGYTGGVAPVAARLGALALRAGADGLVCSAHELAALAPLGGLRVVPGIRPSGSDAGDQKRVATASFAVGQGATWIVVGRPIVEATDPLAAARGLRAELRAAGIG